MATRFAVKRSTDWGNPAAVELLESHLSVRLRRFVSYQENWFHYVSLYQLILTDFTGAPNKNIVRNHLNIALLNVF